MCSVKGNLRAWGSGRGPSADTSVGKGEPLRVFGLKKKKRVFGLRSHISIAH